MYIPGKYTIMAIVDSKRFLKELKRRHKEKEKQLRKAGIKRLTKQAKNLGR